LDVSRHGEGAGLGLAIARWIAGEHEGSLTVRSVPGDGSTFTLSLPLCVPAAQTITPRLVATAET
jgi:signal transduction histidine kinase